MIYWNSFILQYASYCRYNIHVYEAIQQHLLKHYDLKSYPSCLYSVTVGLCTFGLVEVVELKPLPLKPVPLHKGEDQWTNLTIARGFYRCLKLLFMYTWTTRLFLYVNSRFIDNSFQTLPWTSVTWLTLLRGPNLTTLDNDFLWLLEFVQGLT